MTKKECDDIDLLEEERNEGGYHELILSDEEWEAIPEELRPIHEDTIIIDKGLLDKYKKSFKDITIH